jgi:hypothetical protein
VLTGIGGGPTLVRDSIVQVTYNEEIFWGSGVGYDNRDPRTAVGFTPDNHVILFVADGRQTISQGVSLPELAGIMLDLGCVEAMNLDGGGSTQMAIGNTYVNSPSEQRAVPTIFAVVHYDSLGLLKEPLIEKVLDTGDLGNCTIVGDWFETANEGYWGDTKAILNEIGEGNDYVEFHPNLETPAEYEVYAWWVSSSDQFRSTNVPVIISHRDGNDTVTVDQTKNGSSWNLVGTFIFRGDSNDIITISDAAEDGPYVMADAIRLVAYDTISTSLYEPVTGQIRNFVLFQNYPNPFNAITAIGYWLLDVSDVELSIYNVLGQKVATLVNGNQQAGQHVVHWDASEFSSGIYYYRLSAKSQKPRTKDQRTNVILTQKMILLR